MTSAAMAEIYLFAASFFISAVAGIASLLRSEVPVTKVKLLSSSLNSGMVGLAVTLIWFTHFRDNLYFLVGMCVLAGLGGAKTVELFVDGFRKKLFTEDGKFQSGKTEPLQKDVDL